jgi:2-C-methyl-D-erythritol 4-phosphate cytidylyltransferase
MSRKRYVVIMAAGSGTRMGADMPKQFIELCGKAVLQRTIEVFREACPDIKVVTVLPEAHMDYWKSYCLKHSFTCPQILVKGGITRFHSVRNALERVPDGVLVAVHDGVRPLISQSLVRKMFEMAENVNGLIPVVPCVDTMRVLRNDGEVLEPVPGAVADRSILYGVQTPQVFEREEYLELAQKAAQSGNAFTDDASIYEFYGKSVAFVEGHRDNLKITAPEDIAVMRVMMEDRA